MLEYLNHLHLFPSNVCLGFLLIFVFKIFSIIDGIYYNPTEVSRTTTNGSTIYDNNMSIELPTNCEISFEVWSNNSRNDSEHRYFLMPKSMYNSGTVQPYTGLFVDHYSTQFRIGKRENNNTIDVGISNFSTSKNVYHTVKFVKNNTNIDFFFDGENKGSFTLSWIDDYTNYCMSMMRWSSSGTSKLKNVLIKPL